MPQNLETFYGFRLEVANELPSAEYKRLETAFKEKLGKPGSKKAGPFSPYISLCLFLIKKERLFGVGPLDQRLKSLSLRWTVNPEEQKKKSLHFLNHEVDEELTLVDRPLSHSFGKHELSCELDGKYVRDNDSFRIVVAAAISASVKMSRRKVTLTAVATPTPEFAAKFRNTDGKASTKAEYFMNRGVQFLFSI